MKITLILVLLLILGGGVWFFTSKPRITTNTLSENIISTKVATPSPSPSQIPFEELTIPYLRNKKYESKLGELKKISSNGQYVSYLTSYTSDGLKIKGLLTIPTGDPETSGASSASEHGRKLYPAIVFIHGYIPPTTYQTTEKYVDHVDFLARNGFVVFKIDLRGHGDSEGEPGGAYYSSDYIVDVLNAYSALQNSGFVNPSKIGLWGHSMAGNVILRTLAAKPGIPAASIWAGAGFTYADLTKYGIDDGSYQPPPDNTERQRKRQLLRETYGNPQDGNPFWKLVAPTDYLKDLKGAIQLNHAVNDDVVNIGYSRDLNEILNNLKKPHELNEFSSGGHNITNPSFTPAMQATVDFFKQYLSN